MHVSPAKHSYASVTDRQTDGRTDKVIPMRRYASQATQKKQVKYTKLRQIWHFTWKEDVCRRRGPLWPTLVLSVTHFAPTGPDRAKKQKYRKHLLGGFREAENAKSSPDGRQTDELLWQKLPWAFDTSSSFRLHVYVPSHI